MEKCEICGTTIEKTPHITCATCKKTVCYSCYLKLEDKKHCPICARNRKTIHIRLSSDLAVKIAQNVKGSDLNDKLLKCITAGYNKFTKV